MGIDWLNVSVNILTGSWLYVCYSFLIMFERYRKPSADPLSSTQHAERFLAAQAERLSSRYTVDHQPIVSTLSELFIKTDIIPAPERTAESQPGILSESLIAVISRVHKAYMRGYKDDTQRYDPFDDQSLVGDEQFPQLAPHEQQIVMEFLQQLKAESRGKHVAPEHIGTLAVFTAMDESNRPSVELQASIHNKQSSHTAS